MNIRPIVYYISEMKIWCVNYMYLCENRTESFLSRDEAHEFADKLCTENNWKYGKISWA